ncbi:M48 family metalloprotease [Patescibacteria group bacterium]|nr:M48 family metalloprotease [Patescibacteria group bacterium]
MPTTYNAIDSNRRRTWILISIFVGFVVAVGYVYGYYISGDGPYALIVALVVSLVMTVFSWFAGDKVALATTGAQELTDRETFPTLWNVIENLSITAGIPKPRIYIIQDESPNAFATGRDPEHASVAVTTGLLTLMDRSELEGVLAHELSHIKNLDIRLFMLVAVLAGTVVILGDYAFHFGGRRRSRDEGNGGGIIAILGIIFIILSPLIAQLIKLAISRRREYLADASGALLTRYPEGLANALQKIKDAHLPLQRSSAATNHLWISAPNLSNFLSTHPPIDDRITRLRAM